MSFQQQDDNYSLQSAKSVANAVTNWNHAKKTMRRSLKRHALQVFQDIAGKVEYKSWTEDKKVDFVLVYKPIKSRMVLSTGYVEPNPRPMDKDDVAEFQKGESSNNFAKMRVEYINLLRANGLEIEIENFTSKFVEYRAIKICGSTFAMDTLAEKFLLMKPVEPPFAHLVSDWTTEKQQHHHISGDDDLYTHKNTSEGETIVECELNEISEMPSGESEKPASRLYPSLSGYMNGNWGRIRAVLDVEHDKPVDKLIAMYNENLYKLPSPEEETTNVFDASEYVPGTLKSTVHSIVGKFKKLSRSHLGTPQNVQQLTVRALRKKDIINYEESEAFKQLTFLNEQYGSLLSTRFDNWVFKLINGSDDRLKLAKNNFVARAIRAPFNYAKKSRFLGHSEPEFYNSSERSLMVFRILEQPEIRLNDCEAPLKLKDMYREGCFEAAYPLHTGGYKIRETKWCNIQYEQIDNPRMLLRYFWSSSHMQWKFQPINIVKNYFGAVTAIYFAYFGFYNMTLIVPAVVGSAIFLYGIVQMFFSETVQRICDSGTEYLMCADCYIDGTCEPTYISDYCFTTMITSAANNGAVIIFSIVMMVWTSLFVTFWKRQQNTIAHTWGTTDSRSASAEVRVKYSLSCSKTMNFRFNPATGKRERHVTWLQRLPQYALAFTVISIFLAIAFMLTLTITIYNYSLSVTLETAKDQSSFTRKYANEIANIVTGLISSTVILVLSFVYRRIANKLTTMENHRTQKDHDNHLSFKIYLFEFVNYYGTLFYIAFFKGNLSSPETPKYLYGKAMKVEGCAPGGCMSEVSIQMIMIMTMQQLVPISKQILRTLNINRIQEELKIKLLTPLAILFNSAVRWKNMAKKNLEDFTSKRPQFVKDFELRDPLEMYEEYVNNIIQLGFLTMFVTAFPLAPMICLFINVWQLRQDATRYVKRVRRPVGFRAEGIGTWMNILEVLSKISILVNAVLIAFTFDYLPMMVYKRNYGNNKTMAGYVDFMLATHQFNLSNGTVETCRYWSYIHPAQDANANFWMELMLARMLFIFLFQNVVLAAVKCIELVCDSVPKSVKERMVLEEKIAQEWLSSDEDSENDETEVNDNITNNPKNTRHFVP